MSPVQMIVLCLMTHVVNMVPWWIALTA